MANQEKFFVEFGVDTDSTSSFKVPAGTTAQRDASPESGLFRYNTSTNQFEGYSNGSWGEIGGSSLGQSFDVDTFTGDNSTTAFTLSRSVSSEDYLIVFIDGVFQGQGSYVLSGTTLTLDSAPATGSSIIAYSVVPISVAEIPADTDDLTEGSTNLYFTNARVDSRLSSGSVATIETTGNVTVGGDLSVSGGLTVSGTTTTVNSTTTSVTDSMIELANSNTSSDVIDIGIYGNYDDGLSDGGATEYTGLFRDASDSTWKLFDGLEVEPTTTVNTAGTGYAKAALEVGDLSCTTLTATNSMTCASLSYPTSDGSADQVIKTDGNGTLSFTTISGYTDSDVETYLDGGTSTPILANATFGGMILKDGTGGQIGLNRNPYNGAYVGSSSLQRFQINGPLSGSDFLDFQSYDSSGTYTGSFYLNAGKVGIGTSSPSNTLTLSSGTNDGRQLKLYGTSNNALIKFDNADTAQEYSMGLNASSFIVYDDTNSAYRLLLDSSGNIGIGTNSPASGVGSPLTLTSTSTGYVGLRLNGTGSYANDWDLYASGDGAGLDFFGIYDRTNTTYRMVVTNTGNIGIGTSSPNAALDILGATSDQLRLRTTESEEYKIGRNHSTGLLEFYGTQSGYVGYVFSGVNGERMRIDSSGNLLWANTGGVSSSQSGIVFNNTTHSYIQVSGGSDTNFRYRMEFINGNGQVGTITTNGSATAYNTSSDYRLKENVVEMDGAIDRVKLLQPKRFNFIADADKTVDGFLAHEVQDIVPEAIHGVKDEVDEEGNPVYQGIDQSKLVPLLTKAIQEQQTIIDDLKARIETLENA